MSKARIYARNLAANWIGYGANLVVMFFLSPFIVHTLGNVEYGIWSLLTILTGYMGILDLGIRASTGRHIILYVGREDYVGIDETIRTGLGFFSVIALLVLAVAVFLGWGFPRFFPSVTSEYHGVVRILLPLLAMNVWLSAISSVSSSVLAAYDRFDLARGIDLGVLAVRTGGTVYALATGRGIVGLTVVAIASTALGALGNWCLAKRIYPPLRMWPLTLRRARLKELLAYGIAAFLSAIAYKVINQTDLVVVGTTISVPAVTLYSIGGMLVLYGRGSIGQIGVTLFPPIQRAAARGEMGDVRRLYLRQARLGLLCGLPVYIGFIFLGREFIELWMGAEYLDAVSVLTILSGAAIVGLFSFGMGSTLAAIGYVRFNTIMSMIEAGANLGLSLLLVLVFRWGIAGVAAGTLGALVFVRSIVHPAYACYRMGLAWRSYLRDVVGAGLAAGAAIALWCALVSAVIPCGSWAMFWLQVMCILAMALVIGWFTLIPKNEKQRLLRRIGLSGAEG